MTLTKTVGLIIAGLLSIGCANAQRQDTIYQTLASNYTSGRNCTTGCPVDTWGPVQNIGQGFHQAYLTISSIPGHTCAIGDTVNGVPASVTFFTQVPGQISLSVYTTNISFTQGLSGVLQMLGSTTTIFPYIYIRVQGIDQSICQYNLIYSGSLYPTSPVIEDITSLSAVQGSLFLQYNSTFSAGTSQIIALPSSNLFKAANLNIYALSISNDTANTSLTLNCGSGGTVLEKFANMAAGQTIVYPYTGSAYDICFSTASTGTIYATAAGAGTLRIKIYYKVE